MLDEGKRFTRRLLFGMGALASGAAAMSQRAAAKARETADNFPFARTDEADLSADDETLPQRARDLIRIGEIGIAREDKAAMTAFFHPEFRFHGPSGAELGREQLWDYFAACRAAFDDFTVTARP